MREVRANIHIYTHIYEFMFCRRVRQAVARTADGGLVKREGGHGYRCQGVWEPLQGFGSFAGFSDTRETHPVTRFFILGFSLKTSLSVAPIFFSIHLTPKHPPEFFLFQNPDVCYFDHIASIADNKFLRYAFFVGVTHEIFCISKCPGGFATCP